MISWCMACGERRSLKTAPEAANVVHPISVPLANEFQDFVFCQRFRTNYADLFAKYFNIDRAAKSSNCLPLRNPILYPRSI